MRTLVPLVLAALFASTAAGSTATAATLAPTAEQVLRVNVGTTPSSLDPARAAFLEDLVVADAIFTPLYRSPGGSGGRLQPHLAAGQPVATLGGRRWTVRLRASRWSDGRLVRAADVVFAFNRARRASPYGAAFADVRSATAVGERAVRFDLREPVPWFGELLASNVVTPVPSHAVRKHGTKWTNLDRIVVNGPFRPLSGRGRTELVLVANPGWWGARRVKLQRLELLAVSEASASPLFRGGRLDATLRDTSVHPSALANWANDPRLRVAPTGAAQYLFLNTRSPELAEPAVRRGIALAIDRAAIAQMTGAGVDTPLESVVPGGVRGATAVAPAGTTLLREDGAPRVDEARAAVAGAWTTMPRLTLAHPADGGFASLVAARIRSDLFTIGIDVTLLGLAPSQFAKLGTSISPVETTVDLVLQGWSPDYSDPQSFHQLFTCAAIDRGINAANLCDGSYDAAYDRAVRLTGLARLDAHRGLEQQLTGPAGLFPVVPLYEPGGEHLVQRWVTGFEQQPSGRVAFERVAILRH